MLKRILMALNRVLALPVGQEEASEELHRDTIWIERDDSQVRKNVERRAAFDNAKDLLRTAAAPQWMGPPALTLLQRHRAARADAAAVTAAQVDTAMAEIRAGVERRAARPSAPVTSLDAARKAAR